MDAAEEAVVVAAPIDVTGRGAAAAPMPQTPAAIKPLSVRAAAPLPAPLTSIGAPAVGAGPDPPLIPADSCGLVAAAV